MTETENQEAIEALWEYQDPSLSEERFRLALKAAEGDYRLELLTQIARTLLAAREVCRSPRDSG